jgi:ATP-dependent DNA ligase
LHIASILTIFNSVILDGEMLVWDPVSERNLPFGTLKTAALGGLMLI